MKILFVAMAGSVHTGRWISQIADQPWRIRLFPALFGEIAHKALNAVSIYSFPQNTLPPRPWGILLEGFLRLRGLLFRILRSIIPQLDEKVLTLLVRITRPDVIHSLETQGAGYLVASVKRRLPGKFPVWVHTNWGSDVLIYGRMKEHEARIREVLTNCDFYSCECHRDVELAREFGFQGRVLPVFPNTGGFDLNKLGDLRRRAKPSQRRGIMVKGNQGWAGRALVALRAIERCASVLRDFEIMVYSANSQEVQIKVALLKNDHNLNLRIIDNTTTHDEILALHANSRISIGLSLGDAISTSFLEALVAGSFPIQSNTSCANEWITDGVGGILLGSEDPEVVELAIRRAISDDVLVDSAAELNWRTALERLDRDDLRRQTVEYYQAVQRALVRSAA